MPYKPVSASTNATTPNPANASERRLHAEGAEDAGREVPALQLFGRVAARQVHGLDRVDADGLESFEPVAIVEVLGGRQVRLRRAFPPATDPDEPIGLVVRQGLEQDRVDHAEDRGRSADPEREREHRDDGEPGATAELSQGIAQVLDQIAHVVSFVHSDTRSLDSFASFTGWSHRDR